MRILTAGWPPAGEVYWHRQTWDVRKGMFQILGEAGSNKCRIGKRCKEVSKAGRQEPKEGGEKMGQEEEIELDPCSNLKEGGIKIDLVVGPENGVDGGDEKEG